MQAIDRKDQISRGNSQASGKGMGEAGNTRE